jgi:hypothetical protein
MRQKLALVLNALSSLRLSRMNGFSPVRVRRFLSRLLIASFLPKTPDCRESRHPGRRCELSVGRCDDACEDKGNSAAGHDRADISCRTVIR